MKRRREKTKRARALRLWDSSEASRAVPYFRSVTGSLREHWLELRNTQHQLSRLDEQKGPIKRQQLLEQEMRQDDWQRAQTKFDDALKELNGVDVFLLDPIKGLALIPFRKEDNLAWYVFDHFAPPGLIGWRYHSDPIEACRPLSTSQDAVVKDAVPN